MIIKPGDICLIDFTTKTGPKSAKGLLVENNDKNSLWLLIYSQRPDINLEFGEKSLLSYRGRSMKSFGYSPICKGNLIFSDNIVITKYLGSISIRQLGDVCCDIFSSKESWKLTSLRLERSSGVNFWINLNPPVTDQHRGVQNQNQLQ